MKSSRNPTRPSPVMRNMTRTADALGIVWVATRPPIQPSSVAPMITTPPMVGVPRLVKCAVGPSCRMNCPYCLRTRNLMNSGVPSRAMTIERPPEIRSALTTPDQPISEAPQTCVVGRLHQDHVTRAQLGLQEPGRDVEVVGQHHLVAPRALVVGAVADRTGTLADDDRQADVQPDAEPPDERRARCGTPGPSSSISPSTAIERRSRPASTASAFRAARIESGFAL